MGHEGATSLTYIIKNGKPLKAGLRDVIPLPRISSVDLCTDQHFLIVMNSNLVMQDTRLKLYSSALFHSKIESISSAKL